MPVWSPDGRRIAYSSAWVGQQRHVFVKTLGSAEQARLVYTGKRHLHLISLPGLGRTQQVSREGGVLPRWSATGEEWFFFDRYYGENGRMIAKSSW